MRFANVITITIAQKFFESGRSLFEICRLGKAGGKKMWKSTIRRERLSSFKNNAGSTLLYIIAAIMLLGAVGAGIAKLSPGSSLSVSSGAFGDEAYYAALAGLNYMRANEEAEFIRVQALSDFGLTFGDNASVLITVGAKDGATGKYPVSAEGRVNASSSQGAKFLILAEVTPKSSSGTGGSPASDMLFIANSITLSASYEGDVYAQNLTLGGDTKIKGSVYTESSLNVGGSVAIGGAGKTVCINGDLNVAGSGIVTGTVYVQGDLALSGSGAIYGDVYVKGNVTISWSGHIYGNINSQGFVSLEGGFGKNPDGTYNARYAIYADDGIKMITWSQFHADLHSLGTVYLQNCTFYGDIYANSPPVSGFTWASGSYHTGPTAAIAPSSCEKTFNLQLPSFTASQSKSFTGTLKLTAGNYYFTSLTGGGGSKLCLDVSGGDINIFVTGNVTLNGDVYVKTSTINNCYSSAFNNLNASYADDAAKVFVGTKGAFTLNGGSNWFGAIMADGNIQPGGGSLILGSMFSINGKINPNNSWYSSRYVESNYIKANY